MSSEDDVREKQQKLTEIKEIMSQFQEKLNSTTRELNETREELNSTTRELDEARQLSKNENAEMENLKKQLHEADANKTELNRKIKELEDILSQRENEIQKLKEVIGEKDKKLRQQATQKEQIKKEMPVLKPQETEVEYEGEERKTCAKCGAVGHDIKVIENRDKILDYMDHKPIYARKNICKKCGHEF